MRSTVLQLVMLGCNAPCSPLQHRHRRTASSTCQQNVCDPVGFLLFSNIGFQANTMVVNDDSSSSSGFVFSCQSLFSKIKY